MERATIASIAEEAGVCVPTVSRVLNGRSDVAPATRSRVEAVISQRGYRRRGASSAAPSPVIDVVFPELDGAWATWPPASSSGRAPRVGRPIDGSRRSV